jgi:hypothetical protein
MTEVPLAQRQAMFERCHAALRLRRSGKTYREIGIYFNVGCARARQLVLKAQRWKRAPVEIAREVRQ